LTGKIFILHKVLHTHMHVCAHVAGACVHTPIHTQGLWPAEVVSPNWNFTADNSSRALCCCRAVNRVK